MISLSHFSWPCWCKQLKVVFFFLIVVKYVITRHILEKCGITHCFRALFPVEIVFFVKLDLKKEVGKNKMLGFLKWVGIVLFFSDL